MGRCRCGTRKVYKRCCGRWHGGTPAPTPEALMRSRYSAYAMGLADYILDTTHPDSPHFGTHREAWKREVTAFSALTTFRGLEVHEARDGSHVDEGFVRFTASIRQGGNDGAIEEDSRFLRLDGRWYYI